MEAGIADTVRHTSGPAIRHASTAVNPEYLTLRKDAQSPCVIGERRNADHVQRELFAWPRALSLPFIDLVRRQ